MYIKQDININTNCFKKVYLYIEDTESSKNF